MKIFDTRFIGGTFVTGVGLVSLVVGVLLVLPPTKHRIAGIVLALAGIPLMIFWYRVAKDVHPAAPKIEIDTLRKAGMLDKNRKKYRI